MGFFEAIEVACPICKQPMWASRKDTKLYACQSCYEKHLKRQAGRGGEQ